MVRFDHMFAVFALYEGKNDEREKRQYRTAEGERSPAA
jgi:hypothetical protein